MMWLSVLQGDWVFGKRHGHGSYYYLDGGKYEGEVGGWLSLSPLPSLPSPLCHPAHMCLLPGYCGAFPVDAFISPIYVTGFFPTGCRSACSLSHHALCALVLSYLVLGLRAVMRHVLCRAVGGRQDSRQGKVPLCQRQCLRWRGEHYVCVGGGGSP